MVKTTEVGEDSGVWIYHIVDVGRVAIMGVEDKLAVGDLA